MSNLEVNKIIADYMGGGVRNSFRVGTEKDSWIMNKYTDSLDLLVPVWEKLKKESGTEMIMGIQIFDYNGKPWNCEFETQEKGDKIGNTGICIEHPSNSAFESAAHATAKAILALKEE